MDHSELPESKADRVDWVIRADTNEEMRRRYDLWAQLYDSDVGSYEDYLVPREAAKVAQSKLESDARIFDACLLYTSPSPRDQRGSRMPSSA